MKLYIKKPIKKEIIKRNNSFKRMNPEILLQRNMQYIQQIQYPQILNMNTNTIQPIVLNTIPTPTLSGVYLDRCIIYQLLDNCVSVWNVDTGSLETITLPLTDKSIIYYQQLVIKYYLKELNVKNEFETNFMELKQKYEELEKEHRRVVKKRDELIQQNKDIIRNNHEYKNKLKELKIDFQQNQHNIQKGTVIFPNFFNNIDYDNHNQNNIHENVNVDIHENVNNE